MVISYEDMLKLGVDQLEKGRKLSDVKADYIKLGADNKDITRALNEINDYRAKIKAKAKREMSSVIKSEAPKTEHERSQPKSNAQAKKKPSLLLWLIFLALISGLLYLLYLYFSGQLDLENFNINFK